MAGEPGAVGGGACSEARHGLEVCAGFVMALMFDSAPRVLEDVLHERAGFNVLARIFAGASARIYRGVVERCCPGAGSPLPLFKWIGWVLRFAGTGYDAVVEERGDGVHVVIRGVRGAMGRVAAASIVGVLAGMVEAVGQRAQTLIGPEGLRHAPVDVWRIYPARVGEGVVELVAVPPGRRV